MTVDPSTIETLTKTLILAEHYKKWSLLARTVSLIGDLGARVARVGRNEWLIEYPKGNTP